MWHNKTVVSRFFTSSLPSCQMPVTARLVTADGGGVFLDALTPSASESEESDRSLPAPQGCSDAPDAVDHESHGDVASDRGRRAVLIWPSLFPARLTLTCNDGASMSSLEINGDVMQKSVGDTHEAVLMGCQSPDGFEGANADRRAGVSVPGTLLASSGGLSCGGGIGV